MRSLVLAAVAVLAAGCGGDVPRSTVTGTIKFRGRPLREAAVVFLASDNQTHALILDESGRYTVNGVARGKVRVVVQPEPESAASSRPQQAPSIRKGGGEDSKDAARRPTEPVAPAVKSGPPIDPKYARAETSGLEFELKEPTQEWNLDIP